MHGKEKMFWYFWIVGCIWVKWFWWERRRFLSDFIVTSSFLSSFSKFAVFKSDYPLWPIQRAPHPTFRTSLCFWGARGKGDWWAASRATPARSCRGGCNATWVRYARITSFPYPFYCTTCVYALWSVTHLSLLKRPSHLLRKNTKTMKKDYGYFESQSERRHK